MNNTELLDTRVKLDEQIEHTIIANSETTLSAISQLDNFSAFLHSEEYEKAANNLSNYITGWVKTNEEKKLYKGLEELKKQKAINPDKIALMEKKANIKTKATAMSTYLITTSLPYIYDKFTVLKDKNNYRNFFIGWVGYINKDTETTELMAISTRQILQAAGINDSIEKIKYSINISKNIPDFLSGRNSKRIENIGDIEKDIIVKHVVSTADLEQYQVKQRALEFLVDMFHFSFLDAEEKLNNVLEAQGYLSAIVNFSAFDYNTFFSKFIVNSQEALKIGKFDINTSINRQSANEKTKNLVELAKKLNDNSQAKSVNELPKIMNCNNPSIDIVKSSENLMAATLNPQRDLTVGNELMNTILEQRKHFDLKK